MKTVHFHHPLDEIDDETGEPHLQAPCADPETCSLDVPGAHEHDAHTPVDIVGKYGRIFRVCPDGHHVDLLIVQPLTPIDALSAMACVDCEKDLEWVKQVPGELRAPGVPAAAYRSTMPWPGR